MTPGSRQTLLARPLLAAVIASVLAAACTPGADLSDLRRFTAEAYSDAKPEVEPIPEIEPYESYLYTGDALPDPFVSINLREAEPMVAGGGDEVFQPERRREPLEQFPLDSLKMFGTMSRDGRDWVLIGTPDGGTHRVTLGNHLGQQNGKIIDISEQEVVLREVVKGPTGDWAERRATLTLVQ